ncbi:unnamed protein product [Hermetia illucens]|uniref:Uncharacterized protein n=1 Tax=Hermetia illucens TaxID=343691 RepID=A0A7R8UE54_HERIL|nr:unnamed protein product [Hermetia illucens]
MIQFGTVKYGIVKQLKDRARSERDNRNPNITPRDPVLETSSILFLIRVLKVTVQKEIEFLKITYNLVKPPLTSYLMWLRIYFQSVLKY